MGKHLSSKELKIYLNHYHKTISIFLVLKGTYKILRATFLLLTSNLFQSFLAAGKLISFQL